MQSWRRRVRKPTFLLLKSLRKVWQSWETETCLMMALLLWASVRWATCKKSLWMRLSNQRSTQGQTASLKSMIGPLRRYTKMPWGGRISSKPSQLSCLKKHRQIRIQHRLVLLLTNSFLRSLILTLPMNLWTLAYWLMKMTPLTRKWWTAQRCHGCSSQWVSSNPMVLTKIKHFWQIFGDRSEEMKREGTRYLSSL